MPRKKSPARRQPNTFFIVDKGLVYALRGDNEYRILNSVVRDVFELEPSQLNNSSAWLSEREFQRLKPRMIFDEKSNPRRRKNSSWTALYFGESDMKVGGKYKGQYGGSTWYFVPTQPMSKSGKIKGLITSTGDRKATIKFIGKNTSYDGIKWSEGKEFPLWAQKAFDAKSNPRRRKNAGHGYVIMFQSMSGGAGYIKDGNFRSRKKTFSNKKSAIDYANKLQKESNKEGNPYGYTYSVRTDSYPSRKVHQTKIANPLRNREGQRKVILEVSPKFFPVDRTLDEIDADCMRMGLRCRPFEGRGRKNYIEISGDRKKVEKVISRHKMDTKIAKNTTRRNSKSTWKKGKMVWRRIEKRFSDRYQREYTAIGTIYPNKRNQYPYRWSVRVMDSSGNEASGYAKTLKNAKKSVDKHLDSFKRHNPTRRNSNHLGAWRSSFQFPEGVLRSSFFAPEDYGGAKLFLAYEDGRYVVRSRFQDFYRSQKVHPNSEKGIAAFERAAKKFEDLLAGKPHKNPARRKNGWSKPFQLARKGVELPSSKKIPNIPSKLIVWDDKNNHRFFSTDGDNLSYAGLLQIATYGLGMIQKNGKLFYPDRDRLTPWFKPWKKWIIYNDDSFDETYNTAINYSSNFKSRPPTYGSRSFDRLFTKKKAGLK